MTHPQIDRALRLMNMAKNSAPTVAEFEALLTDQGRVDTFIELLQRPGALGQTEGYPNLMEAIAQSAGLRSAALTSAGAMRLAAKNQAAMLVFINSQSALDAIFAKPDVKAAFLVSNALAKASVPIMASNTTPSGAASASSIYSAGYEAWRAFDGSSATFWNSAAGTTNLWLQYSFAQDVFINQVIIKPTAESGPKSASIQYSDDGVTFTTAKSLTILDVPLTAVDIAVAGGHKHWRLFMHTIYHAKWAAVNELNFTGFVMP